MFNKKYFVTFLILLTIYTFFRLFSDVEVEFLTISLNEYREFSLNCGSVYQILIENIEYTDNNLRMNKVICYNNAVLKTLNTFLTSVLIIILFIFGIKYFNKRTNTEDLSDLLLILKRRNKRDI
tara:strand:+ start:664 stop:1035 length:372 start_codon:yes stop_codon:yes gene_type:complete